MIYEVHFDVVGTEVFTIEAEDEWEARERLEDAMAAGGDFARSAWDRLLESVQADGVECVEPMAEAPISCDLPKGGAAPAPPVDLRSAEPIDDNRCPRCGSTSIEGQSCEFNAPGEVEQRVSCNDCGARWTNVYAIASQVEC